MNTAQKIREARKGKGLTQIQLAEKMHCAEQTIVRWEGGESKPTGLYKKHLEKLLGISLKEENNDSDKRRSGPR
jgi:ribosome-binding protein aMBF1 (putative translation factor)